MSDETYNGWKNYPTWAVNLWLDNDRGLHEMTLEGVAEQVADAANCVQVRDGIWTLERAARFNAADWLRETVEELPHTGYGNDDGSFPTVGISADLYGWALEQVNWHELADAWITKVQEQIEA
jgi:hypothetical protein